MNTFHIIETVLASLIVGGVCHIIKVARGLSRDDLITAIQRTIEFVAIILVFIGDNVGWRFCWRYAALCVCELSQMVRFCRNDDPPTKWNIFCGFVIPIFVLIIGSFDFKIFLKFPVVMK